MGLSFSRGLKDNYYSVGNSAHAHNCVTKLHSLQGMVQIQLDGTGGFSSIAHYFVQLLKDMILTLNIL